MQQRLPQLDGIRGIAILLVIFHNESTKYPLLGLDRMFTNGWMGVDLFFVLSGFLITGILLDSKTSEGYFRNFYARRCLRIWPLYYATLIFMFVVVPFLVPAEQEAIYSRSSPWWSFPLYIQNFLVPLPEGAKGLLGVTWSLAIEEQFYLVWPLVIWFSSSTFLRRLALAVVCLSPALRLVLFANGVNLYSNTFARLDGLMAGALLSVVVRSRGFVPRKYLGLAWGVLLIAWPLAFLTEAYRERWIVYSMSAIASAALVFVALYSNRSWVQAALTNRFLVYTGTISYGLYLLHKIPFNLGETMGLTAHPAIAAPLLLASCYGIAALSWMFLERPFLRLKRYFEIKTARAA